jgi:hypothetical protein
LPTSLARTKVPGHDSRILAWTRRKFCMQLTHRGNRRAPWQVYERGRLPEILIRGSC